MMSLTIPLAVTGNGLQRCDNIKESITDYLKLLIFTGMGDCPSDSEFGFLFNNLRFENFDENNGVVLGQTGRYGKKISGTSRTINTFASELCDLVKKYEHRLSGVNVSMSYIRAERLIYVTIKGTVIETGEDYSFDTTIKVWR